MSGNFHRKLFRHLALAVWRVVFRKTVRKNKCEQRKTGENRDEYPDNFLFMICCQIERVEFTFFICENLASKRYADSRDGCTRFAREPAGATYLQCLHGFRRIKVCVQPYLRHTNPSRRMSEFCQIEYKSGGDVGTPYGKPRVSKCPDGEAAICSDVVHVVVASLPASSGAIIM